MTPPLSISSVIIDANVFTVGSIHASSVDVSGAALIKKWPVSERSMLGWSAGMTLQGLTLAPAQTGESVSKFIPTVGARTHVAIAYRTLFHFKVFASAGVGAHVGRMSNDNGVRVVTELEGIGHLGVMFPPLFGLPETISPMLQVIGGVGAFHAGSGLLNVAAIYGGGIGVRWLF